MRNYLDGIKKAIDIVVEESTVEHESDTARFIQTMKRLQEIEKDESNRLDGVVIQKPAGECKLHSFIESDGATCEDCNHLPDLSNMVAYKKIFEDIQKVENEYILDNITYQNVEENITELLRVEIEAIRIAENGEGYAQGIGQTLEATKRTEKMLLDECCEALGWQGGTIHQVKNVLSAAKRVKLVHDEVELSNDWDKFKAAIITLKAVV